MNCSDPVCVKLLTCKWDTPITATWCEAMWYPKPEPTPVPRPQITAVEPQREKPKESRPMYRGEFYGRVAGREPINRER
jgi:hypothetical protein